MKSSRVGLLAALPCLALGLALGFPFVECSGQTAQAGGLEILIATNLSTPGDFDSMEVQVSQQTSEADGGEWATLFDNDFLVPGETTLPTSFSIAAGTSADQVALIRVIATKEGQPVCLREAQIQIPTNRVAELTLILAESCYGQVTTLDGQAEPTCPAGESCQPATGACGPNVIDPTTLPNYNPGDVNDVDASVGAFVSDAATDVTLADSAPSASDDGGQARCDDGSECITLATGQGFPTSIAVDSTSVYWTDNSSGTVMKTPIGGGVVTTLASEQEQPSGIAVAFATVYWASAGTSATGYTNGTVMSVPVGGGTPTTLASARYYPSSIAVSSTTIYWADHGVFNSSTLGAVMSLPIDGGTPTTVASAQNQASGLAVDNASVYWANGAGCVLSVPLSGGTPVTLASGQFSAYSVAIDSTSVYWASGPATGGTVMKVPLGGGSPTTLATGQDYPGYIAVDAVNVYWTNNNSVMSVPLAGGTPVTLAVGQGEDSQGIAVGSTSVFWVNEGSNADDGGTVMQLTPK